MDPEVKLFYKLVLMGAVLSAGIDMDSMVAITKSVIRRYHSECIYIVYSSSHQEFQLQEMIAYYMSKTGIYVTTKLLDDISRSYHWRNFHPLYLMITSDETTRLAMAQVSRSGGFIAAQWLIFLEESMSLEVYFRDIYVPLDCEFLVAQRSAEGRVTLTEVYHLNPMRPLQTFLLATWRPGASENWTTYYVLRRRGNLQGIELKVVLIDEPPYTVVDKSEGFHPKQVGGYCSVIWQELEKLLNFTSSYYIPKDSSYGSEENGTWTGTMAELLNGSAEVTLNLMMVTKKRLDVIGYFPPTFNTRMIVYIKRPPLEPSKFIHILMQFRPSLWIVSTIVIVVLSVLLSATYHIVIKWTGQHEPEGLGLQDIWLFSLGSVCQQAHYNTPRSWPCRLLFITIRIATLILFIAYSATFISFLALRRSDLPFTDFDGLLKDGTYKLGVVTNSARENFFKKSTHPTLKAVYNTVIAPNKDYVHSDEDGLNKVCNEDKFGYMCTPITVRGLSGTTPCKVTDIPGAYFSTTVAMAIRKNSPYRRLFNYYLQHMKRAGITSRVEEFIWPHVDDDEDTEPPEVTIGTVIVFFDILVGGTMLSVFILAVEMLSHRFLRRRNRARFNPNEFF